MSAARFRRVALGLPEAVEGSHGGHPDFRVGKRVFASLFYPDKDWGMVKLTPEQQAMVVDAEPEDLSPRFRRMGQGRRDQCAARGYRYCDIEERADHGVAKPRAKAACEEEGLT